MKVSFLFLLALLLSVFATVSHAELRAGAAKADITPDLKTLPTPLGGYAARRGALAKGVKDRVYAHALVLEEGDNRSALVSLDLCFLPANVVTEVLKRLNDHSTKKWERGSLFLAATHTHSAPDPLAMHSANRFSFAGWTRFDAALLDFTATRIAEAIQKATDNLQPARLSTGRVVTSGLSRNRRAEETNTDPDLTTLCVRDASGKRLATVVNFAAHPTIYDDKNLAISADWPGVLCEQLEKEGAVCLFLNGAEGDASAFGVKAETADARSRIYGERVAAAAQKALASEKEIVPGTGDAGKKGLEAWKVDVSLPSRKPNALYLLASSQLGIRTSEAKDLVQTLMPPSTPLTFLRLGKTLLIGFPCEPTSEIGLEAKRLAHEAGFETVCVVALVNDWLGYCVSTKQYHAGGYETGMSFYGDQFGPTLLSALAVELHKKRK